MTIAEAIVIIVLAVAWAITVRRSLTHDLAAPTGRRILVPFTGGALNQRVLDAALRVSHAEGATLVPAYLVVVPLSLPPDAPMSDEIARAMPLLEAVEHSAHRAGVPVDARIEKGRTPTHALSSIWIAEHFDRVVAPAPEGRGGGFTAKDMIWILTHAPVETIVLRPVPEVEQREPGPRWQQLGAPRALVDAVWLSWFGVGGR